MKKTARNFKTVEGGVCAPSGFMAAGIHCGIKKKRKDLALIFSRDVCAAAGCFTTSALKSESLQVAQKHLARKKAQAVIVNSGNANCCTGKQGIRDAEQMCGLVAKALNIPADYVVPSSTGVIGEPMPMNEVKRGIEEIVAGLSREGNLDAAGAILTTDMLPKECAVAMRIQGKIVRLGGMAKGAGMIHPNMATMKCFLTTDAEVGAKLLQKLLSRAVENSFNCISVDGDRSPSDTVLLMANGASGVKIKSKEDAEVFYGALSFVATHLAKLIVRGGEGTTKCMDILVEGAKTKDDAQKVARTIANSNLVKTAVFGCDANWGRIVNAVGYSGANVNMNMVDVFIGDMKVCENCRFYPFNEKRARDYLSKKEVRLRVNLKMGKASARMWASDLSYEYVRINAEYRT